MKKGFFCFIFVLLLVSVLALMNSASGCYNYEEDGYSVADDDTISSCMPVDNNCDEKPCCLGLFTYYGYDQWGNDTCLCFSCDMICKEIKSVLNVCQIELNFQCPQGGQEFAKCYDYAGELACRSLRNCLKGIEKH